MIEILDADLLVLAAKNDPWGTDYIARYEDDADYGAVCTVMFNTGVYEYMDGGDLYYSVSEILWTFSLVLSGYESSQWGNVSGRYGVNFGMGEGITEDEWTLIEAGTFPWTSEVYAYPDLVQSVYDEIDGGRNLEAVVQTADFLYALGKDILLFG